MRRCIRCTFRFATLNAVRDDATRHDHGYHRARDLAVDVELSAARAAGTLRYWAARLRWGTGTRVMDVGCAEGRLLEAARGLGIGATGLDISPYHEPRWRMLKLDAHAVTAEAYLSAHPAAESAFDTVFCREVIEHTTDPLALLVSIAALLRPGGNVLVETGDAASLQARALGVKWAYWVPAEGLGAHVSFLTVRSAEALAARAGLEFLGALPLARLYTAREWTGYDGWKSRLMHLLHMTRLSAARVYRFQKPRDPPK